MGLLGLATAGCVVNPDFDPAPSTESATSTSGTVGSSTQGTSSSGSDASSGSDSSTGSDTDDPLRNPCPPLDPPQGPVVSVTPTDEPQLNELIRNAEPGTTLEFQPGTYALRNGLFVESPGITLRSSTGNPADVIVDGTATDNSVVFVQAPDVTVAEMTILGGPLHVIHSSGGAAGDAGNLIVYRTDLVDPTLAALKINPLNGALADDGTLACSTLRLSVEKRNALGAECDVSGVSAVSVAGWTVRDNRIEGFWCPTQSGRGISVIESSADFTIERNVIIDAQEAIRLGVYEVPPDGSRTFEDRPGCTEIPFDYYGGVVANNMIVAAGEGIAASDPGFIWGIALWQACGTAVVHNTIASAVDAVASIEYRFARSQQRVLNNLVTHPFRDRDGADAPIAGNLEVDGLASFVDPLGGDVHLVAGASAIDAGVLLGDDALSHDIDGDLRVDPPDVGADEF